MPVIAKLNRLRIAPRKVRLVADLIRRKSVEEAQTILTFTVKRAAPPLLKLLKSAIANAKENFRLEEKNLYISKIIVNEGQKLKRWRPASRGSAHSIMKRVSNVVIVLDEIVKRPKKFKKVKKLAKEKVKAIGKSPEIKKPKIKPVAKKFEPKITKGMKKAFRRKAF